MEVFGKIDEIKLLKHQNEEKFMPSNIITEILNLKQDG